jgi:hypothetical protein
MGAGGQLRGPQRHMIGGKGETAAVRLQTGWPPNETLTSASQG